MAKSCRSISPTASSITLARCHRPPTKSSGGAAYLVSKAITKATILAFEDLGMEAIYEFEVKDMPVTVAVDSSGKAVHTTGPLEWCAKIGKVSLSFLDAPLTPAHG
jgi:tartrate dehydratase beta subunit/fumarate hydratase class I family protein